MPQSKPWLPALDDKPGPAQAISDARASAMVDAALASAFSLPARPRVRRLARPLAFAMAATLAAAAAAAATLAWNHRHAASPTPMTLPAQEPAATNPSPLPTVASSSALLPVPSPPSLSPRGAHLQRVTATAGDPCAAGRSPGARQ